MGTAGKFLLAELMVKPLATEPKCGWCDVSAALAAATECMPGSATDPTGTRPFAIPT